ncbi:MAG: hypothetical protein LBG46_01095 [Elusimicrobiota bacterium]|jgi:hypothetical protein|nr:hypothetical protein [Elusimicrobiota bacterium]
MKIVNKGGTTAGKLVKAELPLCTDDKRAANGRPYAARKINGKAQTLRAFYKNSMYQQIYAKQLL